MTAIMVDVQMSPQPGDAAPSTTNLVNPVDGPFIRFPPFPTAPDGVQIMAFKNFKERGIRVEPGPNDAEVDSLGIPTIPLRVQHSTDECKTSTKRKRRAEEAKARKAGGTAVMKKWWEQWEETEIIRHSTGFNPISSRFERIQAAASDFSKDHKWPINFPSESGPKFIWDKFLRYIGIPEGESLPQEKSKNAKREETPNDEVDEDISDDEDEEPDAGDGPDSMAGIITERDLPALLATKQKGLTNEEKLVAFLDNPEKSVKIFMSSYARAKGYIWAEANLDCIPRVLKFFVEYLLRSKVLPEIERPLRRSVESIATALIELPNTAAIAKVTPDNFSLGCNGCWGKKADGYSVVFPDAVANEWAVAPSEEPQAKKAKTDADSVSDPAPTWNSSWGETTGWGNSNTEDGNGWGDASVIPESLQPVPSPWDALPEQQLLPLLGPTAFPITHAPGVVERSMRHIKSILPPSPNPPKSPPSAEPDAAAVEVELDRLFTKVVLGPMVDWDGGEAPVYTRPAILKTSNGPVVAEGNTDSPAFPDGGPKPHDPFNDEIIVLIESIPEQVALLREGMGIGGTWVQLVRQGQTIKKKKGKGKKKSITTFWYIDEFSMIIPSFWEVNA